MPEEDLRPNDAPPYGEGAGRETAGKRNKQRPNEYEERGRDRPLRIRGVGQRVPEVVQGIENGDPSQNSRNHPKVRVEVANRYPEDEVGGQRCDHKGERLATPAGDVGAGREQRNKERNEGNQSERYGQSR